MYSRVAIAVVLVVCLAISAFGQRAYYIPYELNAPPVRAAGMGEAGVALPDIDFVTINPAVAALATNTSLLRFSFYPKDASDIWWPSLTQNHMTMSSSPRHLGDIGNAKFFLGGAYSRQGYKPASPYATTGRPDTQQIQSEVIIGGVSSVPSFVQHNITLAIGVRGKWSFSFGSTVKISDDTRGTRLGQDFGFMVRFPEANLFGSKGVTSTTALTIAPSLGLSWTNLGEIGDEVFYQQGVDYYGYTYIQLSTLRTRRMGAALEFGLLRSSERESMAVVSLTPSYERRTILSTSENRTNYGFEFGVAEAAYFRIGGTRADGETILKTSGLSVSSSGVLRAFKMLTGSDHSPVQKDTPFWRRIDVTFSFAHYSDALRTYRPGTNFYALTVSF